MVTKRIGRNEVVRVPLDSGFCEVEGTDVGAIPRSGVDSERCGMARTTSLGSTMEPASLLPSLRARRSFGGRWRKVSEFISEPHVIARPVWKIVDGGR
jgi:hypothetical protein